MKINSKNLPKVVFAVFGYGVPGNILRDENYGRYLTLVFNTIYAITQESLVAPLIVLSGGHTDCSPPFKRTEADEMHRLFEKLMRRTFVRQITKTWRFVMERRSISTLENLLYLKEIVEKRHLRPTRIIIFCEYTRERRLKILSKKILSKFSVQVIPIDFDQSSNRYLPPEFLYNKEQTELRHSLWALQSKVNLKKHHGLFQNKLKYFRKHRADGHPEVVQKWWEEQLKQLGR